MDDSTLIAEQLRGVDDPRALLEGLFQHAPVAFQVYRAGGHSLLVTPVFRRMFGSEPPPEYNLFEDDILERQGFTGLVRRAFAGETITIPPIWYDPRDLLFPLFDREHVVRHVAICAKDVRQPHK